MEGFGKDIESVKRKCHLYDEYLKRFHKLVADHKYDEAIELAEKESKDLDVKPIREKINQLENDLINIRSQKVKNPSQENSNIFKSDEPSAIKHDLPNS